MNAGGLAEYLAMRCFAYATSAAGVPPVLEVFPAAADPPSPPPQATAPSRHPAANKAASLRL